MADVRNLLDHDKSNEGAPPHKIFQIAMRIERDSPEKKEEIESTELSEGAPSGRSLSSLQRAIRHLPLEHLCVPSMGIWYRRYQIIPEGESPLCTGVVSRSISKSQARLL